MRLGIDLGGTKIEAAVLDGNNAIVWRKRMPTLQGDYAGILDTIRQLLSNACAENGLPETMPVGIGVPGSLSPATGLMRNSNSTALNGQPLLEDLQQVLQRPVRIANDADCFALSEAAAGAGRGANTVFGVILGTGVGGGIVVNGRLLSGPNGVAGEWGHNAMPAHSMAGRVVRRCFCGRANCVETWLSGTSLNRSFREQHNFSADNIDKTTVQEWIVRMRDGDVIAQKVLQDYALLLAQALSVVINIVDPDVIVLGGGVSNIDEIYPLVPTLWAPWIFSDVVRTRLCKAECGDSSGVIGAAWLWP